jgi:hypothetical protein
MAVIHLAAAARNAAADAVVDLVDAGAGAGTIKIYSGAIPATGDTAESGTLLATVTLADPAFGSAAAGVATGTDPASVNAVATGTAGWFRLEDSTGANVFDGDVTATGGGGTMTLSTTSLVSGSPVDITSLTVTMPAS